MSLVYRRREKDKAYVELEMQGMLDIMETEVSPPCPMQIKWAACYSCSHY